MKNRDRPRREPKKTKEYGRAFAARKVFNRQRRRRVIKMLLGADVSRAQEK